MTPYPLDEPRSSACAALIDRCRIALARDGLFNLDAFLPPETLAALTAQLAPRFASESFTHSRTHNIYFQREIAGLPADHPALTAFKTTNHTLPADRLTDTSLHTLYHWPPFIRFLAAVMDKPRLHVMADPLAGLNAMAYHAGEALNWHFDRSEFTTTLLLQAPRSGGVFQYARDLRSEDDPNYAGVAQLLTGRLAPSQLSLTPGTLNVFKGRNTAHRVTPVAGTAPRMIAVFSYFDRPGVRFSAEEQRGFYGRTA